MRIDVHQTKKGWFVKLTTKYKIFGEVFGKTEKEALERTYNIIVMSQNSSVLTPHLKRVLLK